MTPFEVPLESSPQRFVIALAGINYLMVVRWNEPGPCWLLDIMQPDETLLIGSIPLVTGVDLLKQYRYLGIKGELHVQSDTELNKVPDFSTLGSSGHLYFLAE